MFVDWNPSGVVRGADAGEVSTVSGVERGTVEQAKVKGASPANLDDVVDCEINDALRARKTARSSWIPIYGRTTRQLQRAAPRKIQEENAGPRIGFQIAKRLKHAVSRVVRPGEVTSADDVNEAGIAASMRRIGACRRMSARDE